MKDRTWLIDLDRSGEGPFFRQLQSALSEISTIDGREVIMLGSNNYLGLTTHPKVVAAARDAIQRYGTSCTGSRLMNGTLSLHLELESKLAVFFNKEATLLFSAGYLANIGILSALGMRNTYFISDRMNHASIVDGLKISDAKISRFQHNDPESLRKHLAPLSLKAPKWVVIEGVHSMFGDICPLPEIINVAKQFDAHIILDDAHGIGVLGVDGRGTTNHFGLEQAVDIVMGTFSKSFASYGGFIVGDRKTVEWIRNYARGFIFTASPPPASVAAALAALELFEEEPSLIKRLWDNTHYLNKQLLRASILYNLKPA